MTEEITRRPRTRARQVADSQPTTTSDKVTAKMRDVAKKAYLANRAKNKATKEEEKARKELTVLMDEAGLPAFNIGASLGVDGENKRVQLEAEIKVSTRRSIDPAAFRKAVDDDVFMKCVSVSVSKADDEAGAAIVGKLEKFTKGKPLATVSVAK